MGIGADQDPDPQYNAGKFETLHAKQTSHQSNSHQVICNVAEPEPTFFGSNSSVEFEFKFLY